MFLFVIFKIIILFEKCSYYLANKYANFQASVTLFAHVNAVAHVNAA